jgi:hypothetical protein
MSKIIDLTDPNWNARPARISHRQRYDSGDNDDDDNDSGDDIMDMSDAQLTIQNSIQSVITRELYGAGSLDVTVRQEIEDPKTGLPIVVDSRQIRGGAEIFETPEVFYGGQQTTPKDLNTDPQLLVEYQTTLKTQKPSMSPHNSQMLLDLGLGFLSFPPAPPAIPVKICFSGLVRFTIPTMCHKLVVTDHIIVLVCDKRQREGLEMDFGLDNPDIQTDLLLPDQQKISVITMIPQVLSFDIGTLRCFLFFRRDSEEPQQEPAATPAHSDQNNSSVQHRLDSQNG